MNKKENNHINHFVIEELFDTKIHDNRQKNWKKIYLVIDHVFDWKNNAVDYLCYMVTDEPKKALSTFDKARNLRMSFDPKIIVYYVPETFKFKSNNKNERIREWFELGYPNYEDIDVPYTKLSQAKWIQTFSLDQVEQNMESLIKKHYETLCDDPQHWWSYIEEIYTAMDLYGEFDGENFDITKAKGGVAKKLYSVIGIQPDNTEQQLIITFKLKNAISNMIHARKIWGEDNIILYCYYVPYSCKKIEKWTIAEISNLENSTPDESYTIEDLKRMELSA